MLLLYHVPSLGGQIRPKAQPEKAESSTALGHEALARWAEVTLARYLRRVAFELAMVLAGRLQQGAQTDGAIVHQRKATFWKLFRDGVTRTRRFTGGRTNPTLLAARALDALLGLEENDRVQISSGLAATADVTRRRGEANEGAAGQAEPHEQTLHGDT
jgi:hypothetical protein